MFPPPPPPATTNTSTSVVCGCTSKVVEAVILVVELPPPEDDSQLITIGNQNTIPETKNLLDKIKKGKKRFIDFINQREKSFGGDNELKNEIEYMKPKLVRKEVEEILF